MDEDGPRGSEDAVTRGKEHRRTWRGGIAVRRGGGVEMEGPALVDFQEEGK